MQVQTIFSGCDKRHGIFRQMQKWLELYGKRNTQVNPSARPKLYFEICLYLPLSPSFSLSHCLTAFRVTIPLESPSLSPSLSLYKPKKEKENINTNHRRRLVYSSGHRALTRQDALYFDKIDKRRQKNQFPDISRRNSSRITGCEISLSSHFEIESIADRREICQIFFYLKAARVGIKQIWINGGKGFLWAV